jgi:hypothetical protein
MTLSLAHITFDCDDAVTLAGFWSQALGRPVDDGAEPFFASIGMPPRPGQNAWMFIQVPEGKQAKNRVHVDLLSDDPAAEVARLIALGATKVADHDDSGSQWSVLQDPAGNEFCIC